MRKSHKKTRSSNPTRYVRERAPNAGERIHTGGSLSGSEAEETIIINAGKHSPRVSEKKEHKKRKKYPTCPLLSFP